MFIFALAVIIGYAIYAMSPEERLRAFSEGAIRHQGQGRKPLADGPSPTPFRDALRECTPVRSRRSSSRVSAPSCSS